MVVCTVYVYRAQYHYLHVERAHISLFAWIFSSCYALESWPTFCGCFFHLLWTRTVEFAIFACFDRIKRHKCAQCMLKAELHPSSQQAETNNKNNKYHQTVLFCRPLLSQYAMYVIPACCFRRSCCWFERHFRTEVLCISLCRVSENFRNTIIVMHWLNTKYNSFSNRLDEARKPYRLSIDGASIPSTNHIVRAKHIEMVRLGWSNLRWLHQLLSNSFSFPVFIFFAFSIHCSDYLLLLLWPLLVFVWCWR